MEKHTSSSSKSTSLYKVLSTLAIASVFFSCNPKSDTSTTGHSDTLPTDVPEIVVPEKFGTPQKLPDNVATRVYKLGIASMNDVYLDFREAQVKIETTPALKDLFTHQLFIFEDILPLIIKESRMQSDAVSKSNARGYTQLRSIAIEEVYRKYPELKKLNLDVNCGKDNIILGYVYLWIMRNKVKKISDQLSLNDKEIQQLITFSYNVGEGTLEKLFKASKAKTLEEFRKFCVKKIGLSYKPINQHDGTYNVDYTDILGGRKLSGSTDKEKSKIFEWVRYAHIINALSKVLKTQKTLLTLGVIKVTPENTLFSQVLKARDKGIFKSNASIKEICDIILKSNGIGEANATDKMELLIVVPFLEEYLTTTSYPQ